jgi:hypothetical protein
MTEEEWLEAATHVAQVIDKLMKRKLGAGYVSLEYGKIAFEEWLRANPCPRE